MIEENYIEKPEGKPVKAFRARVKMYGNDVVVVNPMEPRESNRKMIKQKGKSSFYKSEGEKDSSYSIHINVDANDPDPVATMQERFAELTKGELKSELKLKVKGKMLFESPKLKLYLNKTTKQVVIQTTLDCSPTVERELLQLQSEMGRVIGANYRVADVHIPREYSLFSGASLHKGSVLGASQETDYSLAHQFP